MTRTFLTYAYCREYWKSLFFSLSKRTSGCKSASVSASTHLGIPGDHDTHLNERKTHVMIFRGKSSFSYCKKTESLCPWTCISFVFPLVLPSDVLGANCCHCRGSLLRRQTEATQKDELKALDVMHLHSSIHSHMYIQW